VGPRSARSGGRHGRGRRHFRECAGGSPLGEQRRHGDFAIIAVAACVEAANVVRIGVGGIADRPAVRTFAIDGAAVAKDAFEILAWELEGYDDTHASARMRRDLLRRVGPVVVDEALRCAA